MNKSTSLLMSMGLLPASLTLLAGLTLSGCSQDVPKQQTEQSTMQSSAQSSAQSTAAVESSLCTQAWFKQVDQQLISGDGQGHGPDLGSDEWQSVIEFKLGVRGDTDVPNRHSMAWCAYVQQKLSQ
ncbi:hypothetical protein [Shewanella sp. 6_MG-2023]|uniref:hypothetical protein n=1 Tax=Shewanella sp. 6_MG-2023 TaxID=3062660 RepID=UPI0026E1D1D8|nr:hypothetical protein [Shewanella sp. 6_MG-2023]MDO6619569.1 hypothetical protein [Shewanella sp. 6_MG-2023]